MDEGKHANEHTYAHAKYAHNDTSTTNLQRSPFLVAEPALVGNQGAATTPRDTLRAERAS